MTAGLSLRDGSNVSEAVIQRILGVGIAANMVGASGVGSGYNPGYVGSVDPSTTHFKVTANGTTLVLSISSGWAAIQKSSGLTSLDPRVQFGYNDAASTVTIASNATGSTRNDTICLRFEQVTAPDATGSNLPTVVIVQGASGGGLTAAPADSALYLPLANVAVANGATSIAQGNVTDLRKPFRTVGYVPLAWRGSLGAVDINTTSTTAVSMHANLTNSAFIVGSSGSIKITGALKCYLNTSFTDIYLYYGIDGVYTALDAFPAYSFSNVSFSLGGVATAIGLTPGSHSISLGWATANAADQLVCAGATRAAHGVGTWIHVENTA